MQRFYTEGEVFIPPADTPGVPTQYEVTSSRQVSTQIIEAVADCEGVDPLDLQPPLYEVVDPEALEALFGSTVAGTERRGRIEFTYAGYRITVAVAGERTITVDETAASARDRDQGPETQQLLD